MADSANNSDANLETQRTLSFNSRHDSANVGSKPSKKTRVQIDATGVEFRLQRLEKDSQAAEEIWLVVDRGVSTVQWPQMMDRPPCDQIVQIACTPHWSSCFMRERWSIKDYQGDTVKQQSHQPWQPLRIGAKLSLCPLGPNGPRFRYVPMSFRFRGPPIAQRDVKNVQPAPQNQMQVARFYQVSSIHYARLNRRPLNPRNAYKDWVEREEVRDAKRQAIRNKAQIPKAKEKANDVASSLSSSSKVEHQKSKAATSDSPRKSKTEDAAIMPRRRLAGKCSISPQGKILKFSPTRSAKRKQREDDSGSAAPTPTPLAKKQKTSLGRGFQGELGWLLKFRDVAPMDTIEVNDRSLRPRRAPQVAEIGTPVNTLIRTGKRSRRHSISHNLPKSPPKVEEKAQDTEGELEEAPLNDSVRMMGSTKSLVDQPQAFLKTSDPEDELLRSWFNQGPACRQPIQKKPRRKPNSSDKFRVMGTKRPPNSAQTSPQNAHVKTAAGKIKSGMRAELRWLWQNAHEDIRFAEQRIQERANLDADL